MSRPIVHGPHSGRILVPFTLPDPDGKIVRRAAFRGRANLVLLFHHGAGCLPCRDYLRRVLERLPDYAERHAVLLAIGPGATTLQAPTARRDAGFIALEDASHDTARRLGLVVPALVVADRPGEIWAAWAPEPAASPDEAHAVLPSQDEVLAWLDLIEIQEPECGTCVPAWPDELARSSSSTSRST
jgi:peroxiredoxin